MVVFDRKSNTCYLYEVKHSDKIVNRQARYLLDETRFSLLSHCFGAVKGRYVIYRRDAKTVGDILVI